MMEVENEVDKNEYELHKSVFDNDLKKLSQILKTNKEIIDKKVKIFTFKLH
jgi:hypothetical protein